MQQGRWWCSMRGDSLAQSQWAERGRMPFFSLSPDTGREVTYLVRISHARVPFSGGLFLKTQVVASDQEQRAQFLLGAYFGLAALAVFVALANALVYRDRGFGAYAIYVLAMILGQAGITGVGGMLFWPENAGPEQSDDPFSCPCSRVRSVSGLSGLLRRRNNTRPCWTAWRSVSFLA
jgi:hypothetical protein